MDDVSSPQTGPVARLTRASLHHPGLFLGGAALLAVGSVLLAIPLFQNVHSSFEELLPANLPSVARVKELIRRVGGDGSVLVVVEAKDGPAGLPAAEALAPTLVKEFLALGPATIRSVEWNVRETEAWYADHWPMFLSTEQLTELRDGLVGEIGRAKARANPLLLDLGDEADTPAPVDPRIAPYLDPKTPLPRERVEQNFARYRDGFLVHPDGASLTLVVRPTGTSAGVDASKRLLAQMQVVVDRHRAELDRGHLRVGLGGSFPIFVAEYSAILHDVASTALLTLGLVLLSLFLFFRDVRSPISLGLAVLTAVAVTFGVTRLTIGYLNSQTAFLGAIVLGNGINYGLIYLARVRQLRRSGVALEPACVSGARDAARATLLASAASAVSFGILVLAANRGFRHFGIIGGIGMLLCWLFTFSLVPALLAVFERIRAVRPAPGRDAGAAHRAVPRWLQRVFQRPSTIVVVFGVLGAAAATVFVVKMPTVIERDLTHLTNELKGEDALLRDNARGNAALGKSISGAIALLPSRAAADSFCDVIRQRQNTPRGAPVIDGCETVSSVVPRDQDQRLALIHQIARRLTEAVIDAQAPEQRGRLRAVREQLASQAPLSVDGAPPTLLDRFRERDGSIGRLAVVTARPDAQLELEPRLKAFVELVRNVPVNGQVYDATGENPIFADLLQDIDREGPVTTLLSLTGVFALVWLFFRNARQSAEVSGSLLLGVILMAGVATLGGLKINFFNFIVFPITFGIAVDYGANVMMRGSERGSVLRGLAEVGPAVALCSWTTMIGYGSLIFSLNRALRSFGWYALIGEICTVVTALVLLPSLLLVAQRTPQISAAEGVTDV